MKDIPSKEDKPGMRLEYVHDPAFSYMIDQEYRDQLIDELAAVAVDFSIRKSNSYHRLQPTEIIRISLISIPLEKRLIILMAAVSTMHSGCIIYKNP